ncbi:MAG: serine/threonine-protein kinase [Bdellovibrionota bacterium]
MALRFGKYTIEKKLAVGGMAEIYLAYSANGEPIALKRIHPNFASKKKFIQMFLDEARAVISLRHPNIVQMLDFGKIQDSYFFTMEWINGKSLGDIIRQQMDMNVAFPVDVALWFTMDVCEGLAYAHVKRDHYDQPLGIVHRDISPPNILVTRNCQAKVADFGIAEIRNKGVQTQPGVIRGKFSYMSPEQSYGEVLDHRSDLFSVGVMLYEMLMSTRLFLRENEQATLDAVRACKVPTPHKKRKDIPPMLSEVILKSLQPDPDDRYRDGPSFADDLARVLRIHYPDSRRENVEKFLQQLFPVVGFRVNAAFPDISKKRWKSVDLKKSTASTRTIANFLQWSGYIFFIIVLVILLDFLYKAIF